ncbi:glycoside hydrolase family 10 protein [Flexivirga caeni]|uniref:Glycosyl hydrolase-like 10 domain-containing protein n=1 Tax=Flexivirga caeni TaxID=2294115 RepID=A0A3M9MIA3_9MICO|nr:family 10 glycosylhydrolase [Flexivirga caeni]RNI25246.1 hypothetical protein EFY87_00995 [Flexivirga caeni]
MSSARTPHTPARRSVLLGIAAAPLVGAAATATASAAPCHGNYVVPQPYPGQYPTNPKTPKHELRAMWISVVTNIDWPSKEGLSAEEQQAELIAWLDLAVAERHNAVVLQVRPTADALWPSPFEPWSAWLTGEQGKDPGYDPLGFAVTEAHKRNLELHAWFNPFRVAMTEDLGTLIPTHPARGSHSGPTRSRSQVGLLRGVCDRPRRQRELGRGHLTDAIGQAGIPDCSTAAALSEAPARQRFPAHRPLLRRACPVGASG